jgi:hypothetical protein
LTISNFGFWILDFGLRDLGLLQEIYLIRPTYLLLLKILLQQYSLASRYIGKGFKNKGLKPLV